MADTPDRIKAILEAYRRGKSQVGMSQAEKKAARRLDDLMREQEALKQRASDVHATGDTAQIADLYDRDNHDQAVEENTASLQRATKDFLNKQSLRQQYIHQKFIRSTTTATGERATREDISGITRSKFTIAEQLQVTKQFSPYQIELAMSEARGDLAATSEEMREHSQYINERGRVQQYMQAGERRKKAMHDIAIFEGATKRQQALGMDPWSQLQRGTQIREQIEREQEARGIKIAGDKGELGNLEENRAMLDQIAVSFTETMRKFEAALEGGATEAASELGKALGELEKDYRRQSHIVREQERGGGGGGMGLAASAALAGRVMQAGAQMYRHAGITTEMQQADLRTRMAGEANYLYFDQRAAATGDMAALRRVLTNQAAMSAEEGEKMYTREWIAGGLESAGLLTESAGVAAGAAAQFNIAGGMNTATGTATAGINQAVSLAKEIPQGNIMLQRALQARQLQNMLSQISDTNMQGTADYFKGITLATRGMGIGMVEPGAFGTTRGVRPDVGGFQARDALALMRSDELATPVPEDLEEARKQASRQRAWLDRTRVPTEAERTEAKEDWWMPPLLSRAKTRVERYDRRSGEVTAAEARVNELEKRYGFGQRPTDTAAEHGQGRILDEEGYLRTADPTRRGAGRREELMQALMSREGMQRLQREAFLSREEIAGLTGQAVQGLGAQAGRSDIVMAGRLQRAGVMTGQQYLTAREQLTGASMGGAGADNFEEILTNAVAAGMDNSKNLMQMVSGISEMAGATAAAGIDTTVGLTQQMGAATMAAVQSGMSPNVAAAAARGAMGFANEATTERGLTIPAILRMQRLRSRLRRSNIQLTDSGLDIAGSMSIAELQTLQENYSAEGGRDPETAQQYGDMKLRRAGLSRLGRAGVGIALQGAREQVLDRILGIGQIGTQQRANILKGIQNEMSLEDMRYKFDDATADAFIQATRRATGNRVDAVSMVGLLSGKTEATADQAAVMEQLRKGEAVGGITQGGERMVGAEALAEFKEFNAAVDKLEAIFQDKPFERLGAAVDTMANTLDPKGAEEGARTAAAEITMPQQFYEKFTNLGDELKDLTEELRKLNEKNAGGESLYLPEP